MKLLIIFLVFTTFLNAQQPLKQQLISQFAEQIAATTSVPIEPTDIQLKSAHTSKQSGVQHAYFVQLKAGIPIIGTESSIHHTATGNLLQLNNRFIAPSTSVNSTSPTLSAHEALKAVSHLLGYAQVGLFEQIDPPSFSNLKQAYRNPLISASEIPIQLAYHLSSNQELQLAWDLSIEEPSGQNWWNILLDATTGTILQQNNWIQHCDFGSCQHAHQEHAQTKEEQNDAWFPAAHSYNNGNTGSYRVYDLPLNNVLAGPRTLTSFQSNPGSPYGWHDSSGVVTPTFTITRGNNVHSYTVVGNPSGYSPDGGSQLNFDFPLDFTLPPAQNLDASITNLFHTTNLIHDILFAKGFDEAAGNFQVKNFTGLGVGGDFVRTVSQFSNICNASFGTPPDGISPVMYNHVCNGRDGAFSNIIVAHEYAHGLSLRLTGGPTTTNCMINEEQMGEGWSDYLGILLTMQAGDLETDPRGIANWFLNKPIGIRAYPYTTDMTVNPLTYDRIKTMSKPYGTGLNWCTMLWEMTWGLINQHGFDADFYSGTGGNNIALQLVVEGLKLQPCQPGFVDGRDAILAADMALYGGANQCIIWQAFAKRGLGECADQGLSTSKSDGAEGFSVPVSCGGTACNLVVQGNTDKTVSWLAGQDSLIQFTAPSNSPWQATTDVPWITLDSSAGNGGGVISFDFTANTTFLDRIGIISISCYGLCFQKIIVKQGVEPCNQNFATLPYQTGFETGILDQYWCTASSEPSGNVQVTDQHSPIQQYHIALDADGTISNTNYASLGLDLQGKLGVMLSFAWKEFNDNNDPEDGVYISENGGNNFVKVYNFATGTSTYQYVDLDLSQLAATNGLSLTNTFVVRFQQRGLDSIPDDGIAIDSINVKTTICSPIPCDDFDPCTINDILDSTCICAGTFEDSDNDGVCDANDICPGGNDNNDIDGDGIPNFCDPNSVCNNCTTPISLFPHREDFELGLKEICQYTGDGFNWDTISGPTPSNGTGPSAAYEGVKYFYAESDSNYFQTAVFQGGCFNLTNLNSPTLDFWYFMEGLNLGELRLEVSIDTGRTWMFEWAIQGSQGSQWHNKVVDLTPYTGHVFTYRFSSINIHGDLADIALDFITIDDTSICLPGSTCNDSDSCTVNDLYDASCNCIGTFLDSDMDSVCDAQDICPGYDDLLDDDGDGIPNGCDSLMTSSVNLEEVLQFAVYPNPFSDHVVLELSHSSWTHFSGIIELVSVTGRVVAQQRLSWSGSLTTKLSLADVSNGVYYVRYWDGKYDAVRKLVKVE